MSRQRRSLLWLIGWAIYKLAEDWVLDWARRMLGTQVNPIMNFVLTYGPILTWIIAGAGLIYLTLWTTGRLGDFAIGRIGLQFYKNRESLNLATGGLRGEIAESKNAWLAAYLGGHAADNEIFQLGKIRKLILLDPDGDSLGRFAFAFQRTREEFAAKIRETTKRAQASGVDVRWFDGPIASMLLSNPEDATGWVRIEVALPFRAAADRPSFRMTRSQYPTLFKAARRSYGNLWEKSRPATPQAETRDS